MTCIFDMQMRRGREYFPARGGFWKPLLTPTLVGMDVIEVGSRVNTLKGEGSRQDDV